MKKKVITLDDAVFICELPEEIKEVMNMTYAEGKLYLLTDQGVFCVKEDEDGNNGRRVAKEV